MRPESVRPTALAAGSLTAWRDWDGVSPLVTELRAVALRGLARMFRADEGLFAFTTRRLGDRIALEGVSPRYTAIALIGLAGEDPDQGTAILAGQTPAAVADRLVERVARENRGIGDAALACWAARVSGGARHADALRHLLALAPETQPCPTVDLSWALSALSAESSATAIAARTNVAVRLMAAFEPDAGGFPHVVGTGEGWRAHVSCFADQVYPILALSHLAERTGTPDAAAIARRTAEHICRAQGPAGQWWWHYHARDGSIVERYPVYAVHQHAMAPMALAALERVCDAAVAGAAARGLDWLRTAPELGGASLIDPHHDTIWRKVARREPAKAARYIQAMVTRVRPGTTWPWLDRFFPPGVVDHECRPYELGWLLYAWPIDALRDREAR